MIVYYTCLLYTSKPQSSDKISIRLNANEPVDMQLINAASNQPLIWKLFEGPEPKGKLVFSGTVEASKEHNIESFHVDLNSGIYTFLFYNEDGSDLSGLLYLK